MRTKLKLVLGAVVCLGVAIFVEAGCGSDDAGVPANTNNDAGGSAVDGGGTTTGDDASGSTDNDSGSTESREAGVDGGTEGGPGGTTTTLTCGSATCLIPGETCCVTNPPGPGTFAFGCVVGTTCPVPDAGAGGGDRPTALQCSSAANCGPGTVCCATTGAQGTSSECKATCNGGGGGGESAQLCDLNAPAASNGCPQNQACSSNNIGDWGLPQSFATCGGRGN